MINSEEYYDDVFIDIRNLQTGIVNGPMLVLKWGEILANIKLAKNNLEADLDTYKAKLRLRIMEDPDFFGLVAKPTVAAIDAAITADEEYNKLIKDILVLKAQVEKLTFVQKGFDHRKSALSDLVKLYLKSYGSELFEDEQMQELLKTPEVIKKINNVNSKLLNLAKNLTFENKHQEKAKDARAEQTDRINKRHKERKTEKPARRSRRIKN
jgi:hypothetical protein